MTLVSKDAADIAGRFLAARREGSRLDEYPGTLPQTLAAAYEIQDQAIKAWGKEVVGWKIGRIRAPLSDHYGTDRLAGPIFHQEVAADTDAGGPSMPVFPGTAAVEAEFLLRIGRAPAEGQKSFTLDEAADLIDAVHVGIEIASSPLAGISQIGPVAVISDFGNNNGLVVGQGIDGWRSSGFEEWDVQTFIDGQQVGTGRASSFPDGAIGAARFFFELMAARQIRLEAGQWISSGAVTGVHDAAPGQKIETRFGVKHNVACSLVPVEPV